MDEIDRNTERDLEIEVGDAVAEFVLYLLSLGYDDERITSLATAHQMLVSESLKLTVRHSPPTENKLELRVGTGSDHPQEHDDVLLPSWKEFAKALASIPVRPKGYVCLGFVGLQLGHVVFDTLLDSFKTLPLQRLTLMYTDLGISGFEFVTDVLRNNSSLEDLIIVGDQFRSAHDAICLIETVIKHPNVDLFTLGNCGVGENNDVMAAVIPAASNLCGVFLHNNAIGSYGAKLIADCLACNPVLETLYLSENNLDNMDSATIAASLKSNTNLQYLKVDGNCFTQDGVKAFYGAILGNSLSLNESSRSNHSCQIIVGEAYGAIGTYLSCMNELHDPMLNKKYKLLQMFFVSLTSKNAIYFHCINYIPLEMMPKVLVFLQGNGLMDPYNRLDWLFKFIREWSMPLLYTSRINPEKRRSRRIRENRIKQLMVKNDLLMATRFLH